ncbi:peptidylprolyl isomerase [Dethiothermospora halolimnae]|uniref:peptidylprolyl isomerase n=1 Tax=Dethiothermospora halolimnae TaxID=3114390 RepID=UPI003CCC37CD
MTKNKFVLIGVLLLSFITLIGCSGSNDIIAKVNGEGIPVDKFEERFEMVKKSYKAQFGEDFLSQDTGEGKTMEEVLKEGILDSLIKQEIVLQAAKNAGVEVKEEEINKEIDSMKKLEQEKIKQKLKTEGKTEEEIKAKESEIKKEAEENFKKSLEESQITEEYIREVIKEDKLVQKYREKFINDLSTSDEEIKSFYEENKEELYKSVRARHILVEKEEEAKDILKQLKDGADFAKLAEEKSIDPGSGKNGGELGYFYKGDMVPQFSQVAFSLEIGEISEPVKSDYGYHIIEVQDKKIDKFEEIKDQVTYDYQNKKYDENLEKITKDAEIEKFLD